MTPCGSHSGLPQGPQALEARGGPASGSPHRYRLPVPGALGLRGEQRAAPPGWARACPGRTEGGGWRARPGRPAHPCTSLPRPGFSWAWLCPGRERDHPPEPRCPPPTPAVVTALKPWAPHRLPWVLVPNTEGEAAQAGGGRLPRALATCRRRLPPAVSAGGLRPGRTALEGPCGLGCAFLLLQPRSPLCARPWDPAESPAWASLSSRDLVRHSEQAPGRPRATPARARGGVGTQRRLEGKWSGKASW